MDTVRPSFCRLCINLCSILVTIGEDGYVSKVGGNKDGPVHQGYTCTKGRAQPGLLRATDRLLHAQKRLGDGNLISISSHTAAAEVAARLTEIRDRYGADAIAIYNGTMTTSTSNSPPFLIGSFASALGTRMMFTPRTIDKAGKMLSRALHGTWMAPAQAYDRPDVALLFGYNPPISYQGVPGGNPLKWIADSQRRGMQLIMVDPRRPKRPGRQTCTSSRSPARTRQFLPR